ncbi:hypothetical protein B0H13DRAFT_2336677 [Mycena leptocephala]|nr:hypothetical protein B0H13DRAFT_2336677 [Mycena leptocephala]
MDSEIASARSLALAHTKPTPHRCTLSPQTTNTTPLIHHREEKMKTTTRVSSTALSAQVGSSTRYRAGHLARLQDAYGRLARGVYSTPAASGTVRARARVLVLVLLAHARATPCDAGPHLTSPSLPAREENEDETRTVLSSWPRAPRVPRRYPARVLVQADAYLDLSSLRLRGEYAPASAQRRPPLACTFLGIPPLPRRHATCTDASSPSFHGDPGKLASLCVEQTLDKLLAAAHHFTR